MATDAAEQVRLHVEAPPPDQSAPSQTSAEVMTSGVQPEENPKAVKLP